MDKETFEEKIFIQLGVNGAGALVNTWHTRRREILKQLDPNNKSIDSTFIQAIIATGGMNSADGSAILMEELVPGITIKYQSYLEAQHQFLRDLVKLNKIINSEIVPFREWLNQL